MSKKTEPLMFANPHSHTEQDFDELTAHLLGTLNKWEDGDPACPALAAECLMRVLLTVLSAESSGDEDRFEQMTVAAFMAALRFSFPRLDSRGETIQ